MKKLFGMKAAVLLLLLLSGAVLGACGVQQDELKSAAEDEVVFRIHNTVEDSISTLGAAWILNDEVKGSTAVQSADGEDTLGECAFCFVVDDDWREEDLSNLRVRVTLTESDGRELTVDELSLPSEFGDEYHYELFCEDGRYRLRLLQ